MAAPIRWISKVPLILMYHRVAKAAADPWKLAVPPGLFDEQLKLLGDSRLVLPLLDFGRLHQRGDLPANAIAITFDDGYACNALVAAPLLEKYRLPATIFVTTGLISSDKEFWWDALLHIVREFPAENLRISLGGEAISVFLGRQADPNVEGGWDAFSPPKTAREFCLF